MQSNLSLEDVNIRKTKNTKSNQLAFGVMSSFFKRYTQFLLAMQVAILSELILQVSKNLDIDPLFITTFDRLGRNAKKYRKLITNIKSVHIYIKLVKVKVMKIVDIQEIQYLYNNLKLAEKREKKVLNITANENIISETASKFNNTIWSNRYHLGTLNDYENCEFSVSKAGLVFRGLPEIYDLEKKAQQAAQYMFHAKQVETRYLSGVHAVITNLAILMNPGDLVLSIDPNDGGHFASKNLIKYLGGISQFLPFDRLKQEIDISKLKKQILSKKPKIILFDHGATLFPLNLAAIRDVCGDEIVIIYDASHILGLISGDAFPNPISLGCNIVQGNTHKTFPGPHKALTYWINEELNTLREGLDHAFVSSQNTHQSISLYISLLEMYFFSRQYASRTLTNAQILAKKLTQCGLDVVSFNKGFTQSNMILLRLPSSKIAIKVCSLLQKHNISTNSRVIFDIPVLRLGVQEITRRGMGEIEIELIAKIIKLMIDQVQENNDSILPKISNQISDLMNLFQKVEYSFDNLFSKGNINDYTKSIAI